jgi:hypothetical protein
MDIETHLSSTSVQQCNTTMKGETAALPNPIQVNQGFSSQSLTYAQNVVSDPTFSFIGSASNGFNSPLPAVYYKANSTYPSEPHLNESYQISHDLSTYGSSGNLDAFEESSLPWSSVFGRDNHKRFVQPLSCWGYETDILEDMECSHLTQTSGHSNQRGFDPRFGLLQDLTISSQPLETYYEVPNYSLGLQCPVCTRNAHGFNQKSELLGNTQQSFSDGRFRYCTPYRTGLKARKHSADPELWLIPSSARHTFPPNAEVSLESINHTQIPQNQWYCCNWKLASENARNAYGAGWSRKCGHESCADCDTHDTGHVGQRDDLQWRNATSVNNGMMQCRTVLAATRIKTHDQVLYSFLYCAGTVLLVFSTMWILEFLLISLRKRLDWIGSDSRNSKNPF